MTTSKHYANLAKLKWSHSSKVEHSADNGKTKERYLLGLPFNMKITDLIKNNTVSFNRYRKGILYYSISFENEIYEFPVPIEDIGDATFNSVEKAILFMRYIRKAMDEKTLVKI